MPEQLVRPRLQSGKLALLVVEDDPAGCHGSLTIYAEHLRDRTLGRAGSGLLSDLQARLN